MVISLIFSGVVYRIGSDNLAAGLIRESQDLSIAFPIFNGTNLVQPNQAALTSGKSHLLDELILTNLIVLVGGGLLSYVLARETLKPIERAHEQQKRFVADVSHELRTPLTALRMESEVALIDDSITADDLKKVISSNIEEADKLEALINNLMRLTRLEAGELQQQFVSVDLKQLAEDALSQIKPQAAAKNITIQLKVKPVTVKGDKDSLTQMVIIFLDNAVKYSPKNTTITVRTKAGTNNQATLEVIDQGQGIKAENLVHIFDRFYRADPSRSGNGGFGLGLSIAKLIADIHNANITITSAPTKGTTARVDFPA